VSTKQKIGSISGVLVKRLIETADLLPDEIEAIREMQRS